MSEEAQKQSNQAVQEEEDLFGDFEVSQVQQQQVPVIAEGDQGHNMQIMSGSQQQQEQEKKEEVITAAVQGDDEDLFGDFEETVNKQGDEENGKNGLDNVDQNVESKKNEEEALGQVVDKVNAEEKFQHDLLNNHDLQMQQTEQPQTAISQQVNQDEEDLFGDFDTSTPAQIVDATTTHTVEKPEEKNIEHEDLFGDFKEVEENNKTKDDQENTKQVEEINHRQEQEKQEDMAGQIEANRAENMGNGQLNIENVESALDSAQQGANKKDSEDLFGDFTQESQPKEVENGNKNLNSHDADKQMQDIGRDIVNDKQQHVEIGSDTQEGINKKEKEEVEEDLFGEFNVDQKIIENNTDQKESNLLEKSQEREEEVVVEVVQEQNNDQKMGLNQEVFSEDGVQQDVEIKQNEKEGDHEVLSVENPKQLDEQEMNNQAGAQSQDEDLFGDFNGESNQQQGSKVDEKIEEKQIQSSNQEEGIIIGNNKSEPIDLFEEEKKEEQGQVDSPEKNGQQEQKQEQAEDKRKDVDEDLFGDDFMEAKNTVESKENHQPVEEREHQSEEKKQGEVRDLLNEEDKGQQQAEEVIIQGEQNDNVNPEKSEDKANEVDLFGEQIVSEQKEQNEDTSQQEQKEDVEDTMNKEEKQENNNTEQQKQETNDSEDQKKDVEEQNGEIQIDGQEEQERNNQVDSETKHEVVESTDVQNQAITTNASPQLEDKKQQDDAAQSNETEGLQQQGDKNAEEEFNKESDQKDNEAENQEDLFGEFDNTQNNAQKNDVEEKDQVEEVVAEAVVAVIEEQQHKDEQGQDVTDQNRIVSTQHEEPPVDLLAETNEIQIAAEIQHQKQDVVNVVVDANEGELQPEAENDKEVSGQDEIQFQEKQEETNEVEDSKEAQQKQIEETIIEDIATQQQVHHEENKENQVITDKQESNHVIEDEELTNKQTEIEKEVDLEETKQTQEIPENSIVAAAELNQEEFKINQECNNIEKVEIQVNVPEQVKEIQQTQEIGYQNGEENEDLFGDFNDQEVHQQQQQQDSQGVQSKINVESADVEIQEKKEIEIPTKTEEVAAAQGGIEDEDLFGDFTVSDKNGNDQMNNPTTDHDQAKIEPSKEETANQIININNNNVIEDEDLFGWEDKNDGLKQSEGKENQQIGVFEEVGEVDQQINKDVVKVEGKEEENNEIVFSEDKGGEEEKEGNVEGNKDDDDDKGVQDLREDSEKQVIEGEVIAKEEFKNFGQIDLEKNEEIQTPKEYQEKQGIKNNGEVEDEIDGEKVHEDSEYFDAEHEEKEKEKQKSDEDLFGEFEETAIPVVQEERVITDKQAVKQEEEQIEQDQIEHQADRVSDGDNFGEFEDNQIHEQKDEVKQTGEEIHEDAFIQEERVHEDDSQHAHDEKLNGSDDFGEFEETPKEHNIQEIKEISKENQENDQEQHGKKDDGEDNDDDDGFGDFEETPKVQQTEVVVGEKQKQEEEEKKGKVEENKPENDGDDDEDGFGDFEDADVDAAPTQVAGQEKQSIQQVEVKSSETAKVIENKDKEDEDEFGDFEETETKAAPVPVVVAPPVAVERPAVSTLSYKFPAQEVDFSLSGREVDYTKFLCNKLGESISGIFGIGNSNLDSKEINKSNFDGDAERWMSKKYDELSLRSAGNENLKIIAELFKEKQKTIAKTFIKHEKKIIGEPMKGSQLSVLKSNSIIWRDSSSKNNLLKSLRVKEDTDKTPKIEEQEDILPSLKNISSSASSTVPRQSSTIVEDQSEIFPSQTKNQSAEQEIEKKQDKSASQSGSEQVINKNSVEEKKGLNKEQIQAQQQQQQQAEQKKKQAEEDNKQKKLAEQEELKRQLKEKQQQQQQQDLERKKQEQSRQIEQQQQESVQKQKEIDEKDKKQAAQEDTKKQDNKVQEKQDSEEDFDDFQDAEIAPSQQEEKQQQQPQQQQQQPQIQAQSSNQPPIQNNIVDDDFDIFDAPSNKQTTFQVQPQKPAAQFFDLLDDTPEEPLQKEAKPNSNNQGNNNENQYSSMSSNNPSGQLSLYDFQPKKQETVDLQPLSSDTQLDPSAVAFLKSLPDLAYVLSKSLCYPQTLFS